MGSRRYSGNGKRKSDRRRRRTGIQRSKCEKSSGSSVAAATGGRRWAPFRPSCTTSSVTSTSRYLPVLSCDLIFSNRRFCFFKNFRIKEPSISIVWRKANQNWRTVVTSKHQRIHSFHERTNKEPAVSKVILKKKLRTKVLDKNQFSTFWFFTPNR